MIILGRQILQTVKIATCVNNLQTTHFFQNFELTLFNPMFPCFSFTYLKFSFISYLSFSLKIKINSSWLIFISISASDTKVSMLFSLLLANIGILSCFFFFFLVILSNFVIISVVREKNTAKLDPAIPIGAPTTLTDKKIQHPPLVALKTIKTLSM